MKHPLLTGDVELKVRSAEIHPGNVLQPRKHDITEPNVLLTTGEWT